MGMSFATRASVKIGARAARLNYRSADSEGLNFLCASVRRRSRLRNPQSQDQGQSGPSLAIQGSDLC